MSNKPKSFKQGKKNQTINDMVVSLVIKNLITNLGIDEEDYSQLFNAHVKRMKELTETEYMFACNPMSPSSQYSFFKLTLHHNGVVTLGDVKNYVRNSIIKEGVCESQDVSEFITGLIREVVMDLNIQISEKDFYKATISYACDALYISNMAYDQNLPDCNVHVVAV